MARLALLRHGPTAWTAERRLQGSSDLPLSPAGRLAVASWQLPREVDGFAWVTSPLKRARETASLLGHGDARIDARLREMGFGEWEGRRLAEIAGELGPAMKALEDRGLDFCAPGGESPREVQQRLAPFLLETGRSGVDRLAVVHKAVIRALYALATGWPMLGKPPQRLTEFALHIFAVAADGSITLSALNLPLNADAGKGALTRMSSVFFYVQHLLGIGHLRRAAIIARALSRHSLDVIFVSGGVPAGDLDLAGGKLVQLPVAMSADAAFSAIHDGEGRPIDDAWRSERKKMLLEEFERRRPGLVLIEMFPFGRRQFAFELHPLMAAAKQRGIPVAISLRDILVAKNKPARVAETLGLVNRYVDAVLVHGDPAIVRLDATFPAAAQIAPPVIHTGYVAETPVPAIAQATEGEEILVSAGGGAVGAPLLRAVLAARGATRLADAPWRLIAGPNLPQSDFAGLSANLPPRTVLERFRQDFPALMAAARLSISQAGYNTVMDILSTGSRALVLPFAEGAESEQTLRARLLAGRGLLALMEPPFEPAALARAIDAAADMPRPQGARVDLDGANATARHIVAMMSGEAAVATGAGA